MSLSTLKRRFKALDLHRKLLILSITTVEKVNNAVQKQLHASGANVGIIEFFGS